MSRPIAGRMNGVHAEPGTIIGPNTMGELLAIVENDERGCIVGYATRDEIKAANAIEYPRSITERTVRQ